MSKSYVPTKPFSSYKWFWACKQPTEALNDPAVLFGVLRAISFLSGRGIRYNSPQFTEQIIRLSDDVVSTVDLRRRVGNRNLIRNSGQYWSALGLIPSGAHGGKIAITDFGAEVATNKIDQGDFAAYTIATFRLPNRATYSVQEYAEWQRHGLVIYPLRLLLEVLQELNSLGCGWITPREVAIIVVPMAGDRQTASYTAQQIVDYRKNPDSFSNWPDCTPESNDMRFIREYLLFLANYGYVEEMGQVSDGDDRFDEKYRYIPELSDAIDSLAKGDIAAVANLGGRPLDMIQSEDISSAVVSAVSRRRAQRPGQAQFRQNLLQTIGHCPITNVDIPDVLEAAHIKPHLYGGSTGIDNGWPMRVDIHRLFDSGKLRIRPHDQFGVIEFVDEVAKRNYFDLENKAIVIPAVTNIEYLKWRYDNYSVGMRVGA